jgi:hypothetical protein
MRAVSHPQPNAFLVASHNQNLFFGPACFSLQSQHITTPALLRRQQRSSPFAHNGRDRSPATISVRIVDCERAIL